MKYLITLLIGIGIMIAVLLFANNRIEFIKADSYLKGFVKGTEYQMGNQLIPECVGCMKELKTGWINTCNYTCKVN